jgi:hypothetical protein
MLWENQLREITSRHDPSACLTEGCGHPSAWHTDGGFRACGLPKERCTCTTLRLPGGVRQKPFGGAG